MSIRRIGPSPAGARRRPWLGVLALVVLVLQAACASRAPLTGERRDARPHTVDAEAPVQLSVPTRFGAVRVSDFELDEALTTLVLDIPLRVASARPPLYLHRKLALASGPLKGEEWRTPLAQSYGGFCERCGTPGDCLELFKDGPGLDGEDKRDLALALSVNTALEARDAELRSTFSTRQLWTVLSITLIGYMALVAAPEPVSKGVAAALALVMWGYLGGNCSI
ncbi:MAG TPA: hypothetical protein VF794_09350 [Archangium sp.]|uniref:hypothetical protein n=1 Tax=Archangium sp. TaxID=1872627 RepID=UPI002ED80EA1